MFSTVAGSHSISDFLIQMSKEAGISEELDTSTKLDLFRYAALLLKVTSAPDVRIDSIAHANFDTLRCHSISEIT